MKKVYILVSIFGLILTVVPAFLVFGNILTWDTHSILMIVGTLLWFVSTPLWMKKSDGV
jgi:hypothetical protein